MKTTNTLLYLDDCKVRTLLKLMRRWRSSFAVSIADGAWLGPERHESSHLFPSPAPQLIDKLPILGPHHFVEQQCQAMLPNSLNAPHSIFHCLGSAKRIETGFPFQDNQHVRLCARWALYSQRSVARGCCENKTKMLCPARN